MLEETDRYDISSSWLHDSSSPYNFWYRATALATWTGSQPPPSWVDADGTFTVYWKNGSTPGGAGQQWGRDDFVDQGGTSVQTSNFTYDATTATVTRWKNYFSGNYNDGQNTVRVINRIIYNGNGLTGAASQSPLAGLTLNVRVREEFLWFDKNTSSDPINLYRDRGAGRWYYGGDGSGGTTDPSIRVGGQVFTFTASCVSCGGNMNGSLGGTLRIDWGAGATLVVQYKIENILSIKRTDVDVDNDPNAPLLQLSAGQTFWNNGNVQTFSLDSSGGVVYKVNRDIFWEDLDPDDIDLGAGLTGKLLDYTVKAGAMFLLSDVDTTADEFNVWANTNYDLRYTINPGTTLAFTVDPGRIDDPTVNQIENALNAATAGGDGSDPWGTGDADIDIPVLPPILVEFLTYLLANNIQIGNFADFQAAIASFMAATGYEDVDFGEGEIITINGVEIDNLFDLGANLTSFTFGSFLTVILDLADENFASVINQLEGSVFTESFTTNMVFGTWMQDFFIPSNIAAIIRVDETGDLIEFITSNGGGSYTRYFNDGDALDMIQTSYGVVLMSGVRQEIQVSNNAAYLIEERQYTSETMTIGGEEYTFVSETTLDGFGNIIQAGAVFGDLEAGIGGLDTSSSEAFLASLRDLALLGGFFLFEGGIDFQENQIFTTAYLPQYADLFGLNTVFGLDEVTGDHNVVVAFAHDLSEALDVINGIFVNGGAIKLSALTYWVGEPCTVTILSVLIYAYQILSSRPLVRTTPPAVRVPVERYPICR